MLSLVLLLMGWERQLINVRNMRNNIFHYDFTFFLNEVGNFITSTFRLNKFIEARKLYVSYSTWFKEAKVLT